MGKRAEGSVGAVCGMRDEVPEAGLDGGAASVRKRGRSVALPVATGRGTAGRAGPTAAGAGCARYCGAAGPCGSITRVRLPFTATDGATDAAAAWGLAGTAEAAISTGSACLGFGLATRRRWIPAPGSDAGPSRIRTRSARSASAPVGCRWQCCTRRETEIGPRSAPRPSSTRSRPSIHCQA